MEYNRSEIINTDRLIIRSAVLDDVELLLSLWTNPAVMANVGYPLGLKIGKEEIRRGIIAQDRSQIYGRYLIVDKKENNVSIGECKMMLPDDEGISRTDVKLMPQYWGHKFGVEIKQALVDFLFENTECTIVEGTPNVSNVASIKMQEAVGAIRIGEETFEFPDAMSGYTVPVHYYIYHVFRRDWEARRSTE